MRPVRIVLALAVAFVVQAAVPAVVAAPEARQYYGKSWAYNSAKKYYYREYHYKKKATDYITVEECIILVHHHVKLAIAEERARLEGRHAVGEEVTST